MFFSIEIEAVSMSEMRLMHKNLVRVFRLST
jgi:hypothetical protein